VRLLRGLLGTVLWILAAVLGVVAVLLCITIILLPVGIPLLLLSRRLFGVAVRLFLPRSVRHPFQGADKSARKSGRRALKRAKKGDKFLPHVDIGAAKKKSRGFLNRRRKSLPLVG
jgi:hypothetical protein